ncbi:MAG: DNA double-strand break repair nuclease NurA [Candidatus Heimdallarchaeota archaeon]|nr:DNA double-strand break repair nuclease NurA [Candidatus Heimdallarchaeota archaeon]
MNDDIQKFFIESKENLSSDFKVDEVDLMNLDRADDRHPKSNTDEIRILENVVDAAFISGIPIETGNIEDIFREQNFVAIDGSTQPINRYFLSPVLARVAMGSFSHESRQLPRYQVLAEDVKYVVSSDSIVKQLDPSKIEKFNSKSPRDNSLRLVGSTLQGELEVKAINQILNQYEDQVDVLGIDGPLYFWNDIPSAMSNIKTAVDAGIDVFSLVKRSQSDSFINFQLKRDKQHPWVHTDREYFALNLEPGYRSPFYSIFTQHERENGVIDKWSRICTWVKLKSHQVYRVEIPACVANTGGKLEKANDLIRMLFKASMNNANKLPLYFERADTKAKITDNDVKNFSVTVEQYLKKLGLYHKDPDYWK